ncbi:MAG: isoprenylcysteine carboxylmethyltransferase family protein, partial [Pseudomonadota bacterium]
FQERPRDWGALRTHALGWLIKAIFLPLMLTWLINWTANFGAIVRSDLTDPANLFKCAFAFVIFFDLVGASLGYVSTFKIFGTQIKSVQCLFVGWIAALICYPPLNHLISVLVEKTDKTAWMQPLEAQPVLLVTVALVIIALELVYVLATVAFGLHFSNLTHRGIITGGPYRWTKHPAYLAKNCFWWMMALPVMVTSEVPIWIATCVAAISLIYFVRAKSEEIHLRNDTVYRDYAEWIEENGLFAPLNRLRRKIFAVSSIRPVTSRLAGR